MSRLGPLPAQFFSPTLYENHRDDASQIAPLASCSTPVTVDADAADDHNGQQQIKAASKSKTSCTEGDHWVEKENDQDENGPSNQPHTYGALLR